MRILVTGSRDWPDPATVETAIESYLDDAGALDVVIVHGGCPTGADAFADAYARRMGWTVEVHPADWARYGKGAGPVRNQEMVDAGAAVCLAFVMPDSRGTRDCMGRATAAGIPLRVTRSEAP